MSTDMSGTSSRILPGGVDRLPLVSIVMPTYNRADLLTETIESVFNQTYPSIELIILDDGSTDDTRKLLSAYNSRLTWESSPNVGEQRSVNRGWRKATGDYIMVVNSDDPILPTLVETTVAFLEAHPEVLMVYPDWYVIDSTSTVIGEYHTPDYSYRDMVRWCACLPGPGALMRRQALDLVPERDTQYRYVGDFDYWLRLGLHGPFAHIPQLLATHRIHPSSAGVSQGKAVGTELISLMKRYFSRTDLPQEIQTVRREALSAAYFDAAKRCKADDLRMGRRNASFLTVRYALTALAYHPKRRSHKSLPNFRNVTLLLIPVVIHQTYQRLKGRFPKRIRTWLGPLKSAFLGIPAPERESQDHVFEGTLFAEPSGITNEQTPTGK